MDDYDRYTSKYIFRAQQDNWWYIGTDTEKNVGGLANSQSTATLPMSGWMYGNGNGDGISILSRISLRRIILTS